MDKNLRDRMLTVILGVPAVLALILFVPQYNYIAFSVLILVMGFIGSLEMSNLLFGRVVALAYVSPSLIVLQYLQGLFDFNSSIPDLVFVLLLLLAFALEIKIGEKDDFKGSLDRASRNSLLVLYPTFFLTFFMRLFALPGVNNYVIALYLSLAFGNDIFAYIWGRLLGRNNKGVVKVSPKKSLAGYIGSFFTTIAFSFGYYAIFKEHLPEISIPYRILLGTGMSISANIGDLLESVFKRSAGVKDSGNVIPGRGGALDCLDSEISSAPVFFIIFSMILEAAA